MLRLVTADPLLLGRPLHVYLGLVLLVLVTFQLVTGLLVHKRKAGWLPHHRRNSIVVAGVGFIHVYFGVGVWFLGFTNAR